MKLKFILFSILLALSIAANGQLIDTVRMIQHDSTKGMNSVDGYFDENGNFYTISFMRGTLVNDYVDIDLGPGETKIYEMGIYLIKYNADFELIWHRKLHKYEPSEFIARISGAKGNRLIISGKFEDTVDLDPDPNHLEQHRAVGKGSKFLVEFDSSGNYIKSAVFSGLKKGDFLSNSEKMDIHFNPDGSYIVYSTVFDSMDLDPGPGIIRIGGVHPPKDSTRIESFLLHLDQNFNYKSHVLFPKNHLPSEDVVYDFQTKFHQNKVYVFGSINLPLHPDRNNPAYTLIKGSEYEFVLFEYDHNLNLNGHKTLMWATHEMNMKSMNIGSQGQVYFTGAFTGQLRAHPSNPKFQFQSNGWQDILVLKFDNLANLNPLAAYQTGTAYGEESTNIGLLNDDQPLIFCHLYSEQNNAPSPDFDPGHDTAEVDKFGTYGWAILRLDSDLNYRWVGSWKWSGINGFPLLLKNDSTFLMAASVAIPKLNTSLVGAPYYLESGNAFVAKSAFIEYRFPNGNHYSLSAGLCEGDSLLFKNQYYSKPGDYQISYLKSDYRDSVIELNLTQNPSYLYSSKDTVCQKYVESWHGKTLAEEGIYYDSLKTTLGCDSIFQRELIYRNFTINVQAISANTLTATGGFKSYQWVNCYENYKPISGANLEFYEAPIGGLYGAIVEGDFGCRDTSNCVQIQGVGMPELNDSQIKVYPNPFTDHITIEGLEIGEEIRIYNPLGVLVYKEVARDSNVKINMEKTTISGVYWLLIAEKQFVIIKK